MPEQDSSRSYKQIGETLLFVQQIMTSYLHAQPVDSVCFSPDGTLLASAASDDCVRLWDVAERKPVSILEGRTGAATPSQVSFSADSKLLAASVGGGIVQLWTSDGKTLAELSGHDPGPTEAVFSPKGRLLASGDLTGRVRLWDAVTRQVLCSFVATPLRQIEGLERHGIGVHSFAFTPDGMRLALNCQDTRGRVQVWDLQYPELQVTWAGSLLEPSVDIWMQSFSPDGRVLALAGLNRKVVWLFNAYSLALEETLQIPDDFAKALAFSPDGRFLATAGAAGTVWIWELSSRQIVGSFAAHPEGPDYRENAQEWALGDMDWSSDGRYLVTCGRDPYTVKLWKVQIRI